MSKIKSNFRISLDLFELATFGTNYGLQTVNEIVTRCPKVPLWYFVPLAPKRFLEVINTFVFFSANLAFQNTAGIIVQAINIRRFWSLLCGINEAWMARAKVLLLECPRSVSEIFAYPRLQ